MDFNYSKKESYTQEDLDNLLTQHSAYVEKGFKDYVSQEDYKKVVDELQPFKDEEKKSTISQHLPENAHPEATDDIIRLANIEDEDDEETIKGKLAETVNSKSYLQKAQTEDPKGAKPKVDGEGETKPETKEDSIKKAKMSNL